MITNSLSAFASPITFSSFKAKSLVLSAVVTIEVKNAITPTPPTTKKIVATRPSVVTGLISPKPTVEIVITDQ